MDDDELTAGALFMWIIVAVAIVGIIAALLVGPAP